MGMILLLLEEEKVVDTVENVTDYRVYNIDWKLQTIQCTNLKNKQEIELEGEGEY